MAQEQRKYEKEYKVQAVKLAKEIGAGKAAKELGIPVDTLYGWQKAVREGRLDAGPGSRGPGEAMSLAEELGALRKHEPLSLPAASPAFRNCLLPRQNCLRLYRNHFLPRRDRLRLCRDRLPRRVYISHFP